MRLVKSAPLCYREEYHMLTFLINGTDPLVPWRIWVTTYWSANGLEPADLVMSLNF